MHTSDFDRSLRARTRRSRLLSAALLAVAGLGAAGCTESIPPIALASLRILPQVDSFYTGQTTSANPFAITLFDLNGTEIKDGRKITYTSSAPTVFTVDPTTGVVAGKTIGLGLFRATSDGRFIEATVKIIAPVDRVQLNTGDFTLNTGNQRQITPTLVAADGSSISGRTVTYSASNPSIASVSTTGLVTAVTEGTSTITASVEGKSAAVVVTVAREAVAGVTLNPPVAQIMRVGGQLQITATPRNATGGVLTGRSVTWFTNNPTVASVSQQGVVTALAVGSATITAEIELRTASLTVNVSEVPAKTVTIDPDNFALGTGLTRQLTLTVIDSAGKVVTSLANRQVVWLSSSSIVATVNNTGVVTGTGAGTARISVTVDGVKSNDAVVNVSPQVSSVRLTPSNPQLLRVGTSVQVSAQALDNQNQPIPGKTANWFTNNPTVASVSASGLITGVGVGTTTITADIDGRSSPALQVTVTLVPVLSVTFTPTTDTLVVGDTPKQYNPAMRDSTGAVIPSMTGRVVGILNDNSPIASVATVATGIVVSAVTAGTANINLTLDQVTSNTLKVVAAQVATVTVSPNPITVSVGQNVQLTWVLKDGSGNILRATRPPTFVSFQSSVATVSSSGMVTGLVAGTTTISVSFGSGTTNVPVTVNP